MGLKETFYDLLLRSVITRFLISAMLVATCCWLWINNHEPSGALLAFTGSTIGFFFSSMQTSAATYTPFKPAAPDQAEAAPEQNPG